MSDIVKVSTKKPMPPMSVSFIAGGALAMLIPVLMFIWHVVIPFLIFLTAVPFVAGFLLLVVAPTFLMQMADHGATGSVLIWDAIMVLAGLYVYLRYFVWELLLRHSGWNIFIRAAFYPLKTMDRRIKARDQKAVLA